MEILAGFIIALAIGITGVGAGTITAPILILFFHQTASDAVTTALIFGTVVKLIATPIYWSRGQVNLKVLKLMAVGGIPAAIIGSIWLIVVVYLSLLLAFPDALFRTGFLLSAIYVGIDQRCHAPIWKK